MSFEWLVPYLLVATLIFLLSKLFGMLGKRNSPSSDKPAFVPHYTYIVAGIIMAGILLYIVAKVVVAVASRNA